LVYYIICLELTKELLIEKINDTEMNRSFSIDSMLFSEMYVKENTKIPFKHGYIVGACICDIYPEQYI